MQLYRDRSLNIDLQKDFKIVSKMSYIKKYNHFGKKDPNLSHKS
jgi:hypothetical protein